MTFRPAVLTGSCVVAGLLSVSRGQLESKRMFAQETAAIQGIKTLHTAQVQYFS